MKVSVPAALLALGLIITGCSGAEEPPASSLKAPETVGDFLLADSLVNHDADRSDFSQTIREDLYLSTCQSDDAVARMISTLTRQATTLEETLIDPLSEALVNCAEDQACYEIPSADWAMATDSADQVASLSVAFRFQEGGQSVDPFAEQITALRPILDAQLRNWAEAHDRFQTDLIREEASALENNRFLIDAMRVELRAYDYAGLNAAALADELLGDINDAYSDLRLIMMNPENTPGGSTEYREAVQPHSQSVQHALVNFEELMDATSAANTVCTDEKVWSLLDAIAHLRMRTSGIADCVDAGRCSLVE